MKLIFNIFRFTLLILYVSLLVIHFIIKDRFHAVSFFFYACPLPLIIIFGVLLLPLFYKLKRIRHVLLTILLGCSIYFYFHYFGSSNKEMVSKPKSHILFWNAAQNVPLPTKILVEHIKTYKPEIIALVEAVDVSEEDFKILKNSFPEYQFQQLEGTMLIGVKGTVESVLFKSSSDIYKFNYISATVNNLPMHILISDVYASPLLNKQIPLGIIHRFTKEHDVDVLLGDFNTPYESVFFKPFKTDFKSFHRYSKGFTSTWPVPIPMIEIDQIWLDNEYTPIKLQKFSYKISDHKLLIAEFQ